MEDTAKLASKMAKEDIDEKKAELRAFSRAAHTGIEERSIEVEHRPNNDRFTIETIGIDTGEVVATRPMREDELRAAKQTLLPLRDMSPAQVVPIREGTTGGAVEGIRQTTGGISPLRGNTRGGQPTT